MKKILLISFLILTSLQLFAQNTSAAPKKKGVLPETLFNLDFNGSFSIDNGIPTTVMPVKALIGSKNTGIIVGFQSCIMGDYKVLRYSSNCPTFLESQYFNSSPNSIINNKGFSIRLGYQKALYRGLYATVSADLTRIKADVSHTYFSASDFLELDRKIRGMRLNAGLGYTISIGKAKKFYLNLFKKPQKLDKKLLRFCLI